MARCAVVISLSLASMVRLNDTTSCSFLVERSVSCNNLKYNSYMNHTAFMTTTTCLIVCIDLSDYNVLSCQAHTLLLNLIGKSSCTLNYHSAMNNKLNITTRKFTCPTFCRGSKLWAISKLK